MTDNYVYILKCSDQSLYTGYTTNLEKRLKVHNSGKGAKYTRARLPVEYVFSHKCESKSQALSLEYKIKQLTRPNKLKLIEGKIKIGDILIST